MYFFMYYDAWTSFVLAMNVFWIELIFLFWIVKDKTWHQSTRFINSYAFILSNLNNVHSPEVVDRVSETHFQVSENSN